MTTKLSDEFMAECRLQIEQGTDKPGSEGAFFRLLARLDPNALTEFIYTEYKRGEQRVDANDLIAVFRQFTGMLLYIMSGVGGKSLESRMAVLAAIQEGASGWIDAVLNGEYPLSVVVVNAITGEEREATAHGITVEGIEDIIKRTGGA